MKKTMMRAGALLMVGGMLFAAAPDLMPVAKATQPTCPTCNDDNTKKEVGSGIADLFSKYTTIDLAAVQEVWDVLVTYCYENFAFAIKWVDAFLDYVDVPLGYADGSLKAKPDAGGLPDFPDVKDVEIQKDGSKMTTIKAGKACDSPAFGPLVKISGRSPFSNPTPPVPIDGGASLLLAAGAAYGLKRLRSRKNTDA